MFLQQQGYYSVMKDTSYGESSEFETKVSLSGTFAKLSLEEVKSYNFKI